MEDIYTLICEYLGGTYIVQVHASSPADAVLSWLNTRSVQKYIPDEARLAVRATLADDSPVALNDCTNVWCFTTSTKAGLILINLALTR
jgi:predicted neuraminidase